LPLRFLFPTSPATHERVENASISHRRKVAVEIWIGGTVNAAAKRAGRLGDAWLTGQNATDAQAGAGLRPRRPRSRRSWGRTTEDVNAMAKARGDVGTRVRIPLRPPVRNG